jgi:hypothetical protein
MVVDYDAVARSAGSPRSFNRVFTISGPTIQFNQLTTNGTIITTNNTGQLAISSTAKLKVHDGFIEDGIGMLMKFIPRYFYWKDTNKFGEDRQLGFFAQEVNEICEEAANTPKSADQGWGIIDRGMIAVLVKANQEQNIIVDDMNSRLDDLLKNFGE